MSRGIRLLSGVQHTELAELPANPAAGRMEFVNGVLYIYGTVGEVTTWWPLNRAQSSYVHSQGVTALEWVISHGLDSKDLFVAIYDNSNAMMDAEVEHFRDTENGNVWKTRVVLAEPSSGYAVVTGVESMNVPTINATKIVTQSIEMGEKTITEDNLDATHLGGVVAADYITVNDTIDAGTV